MTVKTKLRRCLTAHDVEPMQAALIILILAIGAMSVFTFKALDRASTNADKIEAAVDLAKEAQGKLDNYQRVACERGNVLRAYLIIRCDLLGDAGGSAGAARKVFQITECSGAGRYPATEASETVYLRKIAKRMGVSAEWRAVTN